MVYGYVRDGRVLIVLRSGKPEDREDLSEYESEDASEAEELLDSINLLTIRPWLVPLHLPIVYAAIKVQGYHEHRTSMKAS